MRSLIELAREYAADLEHLATAEPSDPAADQMLADAKEWRAAIDAVEGGGQLYVSFVMKTEGERTEGWLVLEGRCPRSAHDVRRLCAAICAEVGADQVVPINWKVLAG